MKAFKWIPPFLGEGSGCLVPVPYEDLVKVPITIDLRIAKRMNEAPEFTHLVADEIEALEELLAAGDHACQTGDDCGHTLQVECDQELERCRQEVKRLKETS